MIKLIYIKKIRKDDFYDKAFPCRLFKQSNPFYRFTRRFKEKISSRLWTPTEIS